NENLFHIINPDIFDNIRCSPGTCIDKKAAEFYLYSVNLYILDPELAYSNIHPIPGDHRRKACMA
ncbi:MAG: hypothetical protein PHS87_04880, partial [Petrimonas sp.]|nr:hypothetical protein [Petrimonas sp.]